ncbi:hypothetical protein CDD80_327 [Ophiocordyceps camponoti-rufipedis]|uniref:Transmembrane protein n=1 Tax=Ophiocordyceps camponoti-rufipedis TaxID=2004952 RepID=A0A2C5Z746_9HYPO|nr:hypothetical protein CDD80_327 [Ophiocordyceps camponoti-rufipedis]
MPQTASTPSIGLAFLDRRLSRCSGWNCLSSAQKSGIIFSIAFVSVVLFLFYMHCLGKAAISRRERRSVRLPGGRRVPRQNLGPHGSIIAQLPVVWRWPGNRTEVVYQPALFDVEGRPGPRAHPVAFSDHHQYSVSSPGIWQQRHGGNAHPAIRPMPSQLPASPRLPNQPTWRQRLSRAMRLPVGRASTIASDSVAGGSATRESLNMACLAPAATDKAQSDDRLPQNGRGCDDTPEASETRSIQTNVATVHSDDFHMVEPTPRPTQRHDTIREHSVEIAEVRDLAATGEPAGFNDDLEDGRHEKVRGTAEKLQERFWIPSVSSFHPYNGRRDQSEKGAECGAIETGKIKP